MLLLIITICSLVHAQESGKDVLKFKQYTIFDGLPSTSVTGITQDHEGFMWFGTRNGLSRFDGFNFTNFYKDTNDPLSLSHNQVQITFIDSQGNLWIGTKNGLNRYIKDIGFEKYFKSEDGTDGIAGNIVLSIYEDGENNIWLGTNEGISLMNRETNKISNFINDPDNENSLKNNYVMEIYIDSESYLWAITDSGIDRFHIPTNTFKHYTLETKEKSTLKEVNFASDILEDSNGQLWIGNTDGLWYYDEENDKFKSFTGQENMLSGLSIRSLVEDENNNLLIGAYSGYYVHNIALGTTYRYEHNKSDPYSLNNNSIHVVFKDATNNLWLGTWAGGINYLDRHYDSFKHYTVASGLSFPVVSSFVEDPNSNFWIGTEGGGINYFDRKSGNFFPYRHDTNNSNSLSENNVHDMVMDDSGHLVIATFAGGINYFNPKETPAKFIHLKNNPEDSSSISSNYIFSLLNDSKGRIWVGTSNAGLNQFHPEKKTFTRFTDVYNRPSQIVSIFEDKQNRVLVGTSNGLGMIDGLNNKIVYNQFEKFNSKIKELVVSIHQDADENFWLATEGDGLILMGSDFSIIYHYQKSDGLPSNVVYGILPDGPDHLWLSTHNGISKFNITEKTFDNFDVHDGLQSNEFNFDAYHVSSKGELMFGGVNGFNIFHPSDIHQTENDVHVMLTDFKVNEKSVKIGAKDSQLTMPISETEQIVLEYDESLFSFDFIALNYARPSKNNYAYMLEGFNTEWLYIEDRRQVTFTNIEPGDYTFRVKASEKGNIWPEKSTSVKITVLPPPWKTWWAFTAYFLLAVLVGYTILHYARLRIQDRRALKKEKSEREKNEEMHELKLQFFTNVSHELRTPLTLIIGPLEKLMNQKDNFNEQVQGELSLIDKNAKNLMRHIGNIMEFRKDEMGKLKLKAAKGNFVKFSNETFLSFRQLSETRNIEYVFSSKLDFEKLYFDRYKMEIALYNLLANAFKFTPDGGKISMKIFPVESKDSKFGRVGISISDTGIGIDAGHVKNIFNRFFQIDDVAAHMKGSGIGLALTKSLVELHYGMIKVKSEIGKGTCFTIELPYGKKHLKDSEIYKEFRNGEDVANYSESTIKKKSAIDLRIKKKSTLTKENAPLLLIVEDNHDVRRFIVDCFKEDYNIKEAANGGTGYEMATELIPDLIISDVMMPEMDGITLCSKLKKDINTSHIPIILLTARTSLIFKKDGLETGADDYINKPFTPSILKLKVRNLMESRKKSREYFVRNYRVNPKEIVLTSKDDEFLEKAIQCVEKHLSDSEFNVSLFINEMGMSRSVLFRKIKGLTGQSTTEFIRTIRIKRAAQILKQNQLSISETAYEVGFNDLKYFRTCFRKQFNSSPSEFISKQTEQKQSTVQN